MSIAEKLTKINNIKDDIKAALEYKGLAVTDLFDTYADLIRTLGAADGTSSDPFASIGYIKNELMYWLDKQLADSLDILNNWDSFATKLNGSNICFYPVVDTTNITDASYAFSGCSNLLSIGLLYTGNVINMSNMFKSCTKLTTIPQLNVRRVLNFSNMFIDCNALEIIPELNAEKGEDFSGMFNNCTNLKLMPLIDTRSALNMSYMFQNCKSLEYGTVYSYDTSKVTNMSYMFSGCTNLRELSFRGCDLSKVKTFDYIISGCSNLNLLDLSNTKIGNYFRFADFANANEIIYDGIDTSAMTDTSYMFQSYSGNIDISNFDLSNVTDMSYTFYRSYSPSIILGNVNTSKVTDMSYMFSGCTKIQDLDLSGIDVSLVNNMSYMFDGCTKLANLNFTGWNTDSLTNMLYMFQNCSALDTLDLSMFDTSKVTKMDGIFNNCTSNTLILDGWNVSNNSLGNHSSKNVSLKNMIIKQSFTCPYASESIDLSGIDTTACTSFKLNGCDAPTIDVSSLNTSNFTSMSNMFYECGNVTSLNISHFDYSKVTDMSSMFRGCSNLSGTLIMGGTNEVTSMQNMFYGCSSLTKIDLTNLQLDLVTNMSNMFYGCTSLEEVKMGGNPAEITGSSYVDNMFYNIATEGVLYYNTEYDYSKIIAKLPSTWKAVPLINPTECTSLTIEADDISWNKTSTTIRYTAIVNGINPSSGNTLEGIELTGTFESDDFGLNTTDTDKTHTISYTYLGVTATTTIIQRAFAPYTINLNNQWLLSTEVENPDPTLYDGVYESFSNYNVQNSYADCIITINGYENFDIYVRSNAEGTYDYVIVYNLDSESSEKYNTSGKQNSGTGIDSYTLVSFTDIDPDTEHTIKIRYKKDNVTNSGTDKGYLLIPKNQ